jgi:DNA-binding transcriptional ArsR family regulator
MDADADLPADLRAFLYSCIDSVDQADLLVRLRASGTSQSVRQLAAITGLRPQALRHHLEILVVRGLLRADVSGEVEYRYAPETPELRRYSDLLQECYASRRDQVIRAISARAARTFADAFKFKKEP